MSSRGLLPGALLAGLLTISFSALASDPIQFNPADSYEISSGALRMTAGDFNGDGWQDIAGVAGLNFFGVMLNQGDGTFSAAGYSTSSNVMDLAVVNLAGDAYPDLVLFNYDGTAQIYSGDGLGGFVNTDTLPLACGSSYWHSVWLAAGDFNQDGLADVALDCGGAITVALGNPAGGLDPQTPLNNITGSTLAAGLIDADAIPDLVTVEEDRSDHVNIVTMAGDGNGGFVRGKTSRTDLYFSGSYAENQLFSALGDLNGDGINDLVFANVYYYPYHHNLQVWFGDGTGGFARGPSFLFGSLLWEVKLADANGDGKLDVLVADIDAAPGVYVILSYGNGTFSPVYTFFDALAANSLAVADFDHHGAPDLAAGLSDGKVHVMFGVTVDQDHDLLSDADETIIGTDPADPDTDGDGMPDGWEAQFGLDTLVNDAAADADEDGVSNLDEYQHGLDPSRWDTDGDGMADAYELARPCLIPYADDAAADPDHDYLANNDDYYPDPDPCVFTDTDGDLMPDGWEIQYYFCGLNPWANDANGHADGDCYTNLQEYQNGTDPCTVNYAAGPVEYQINYTCQTIFNDRVAVADFNQDGFPDYAALSYGSYGVSLNNGDGTFTLAGWVLGTYLQGMAVIMLPGDAYPDLIISDAAAHAVYVLGGNGDGTFTQRATLPAGAAPYGLAAADLNNDGIADIVAGLGDVGKVGVFLGNGVGGFGPVAMYNGGGAEVAVGLVNADGYPDVVTAGISFSVMLGDGTGVLGAPSTTDIISYSPTHLALGDVDQDGKLDVVAGTGYTVNVFFGDGQAGWRRRQTYSVGAEAEQIHLADLNGDGRPDVLIGSNDNDYPTALWFLLNYGNGSLLPFSIPNYWYSQINDIAAADFNRDGVMDLVLARCLHVELGVQTDSDADQISDADEAVCGTDPHDADSDGDGMPDGWEQSHATCGVDPLVNDAAQNEDWDCLDNFTEYQENTDPCVRTTFQDPVAFGPADGYSAVNDNPIHFATGDFNRDGYQDLAAVYDEGGFAASLNDGDGKFTSAFSTASGGARDLAVMDFNADGNLDLAVIDYNLGMVVLALGDGSGGFSISGLINVGTHPTAMAAGDFNGDARPDLAVCREDGPQNLMVLLGAGGGGFGTPQGLALADACAGLALGQVNADTNLDLAVAGGSHLTVLLGDGSGGFGAPRSIPIPPTGVSVALGDLNEDGKLDAAAVSSYPEELLVLLLGDGDGAFTVWKEFSGFVSSQNQVRIADLNRDGHLDVAGAISSDGGGLGLLLNYGHGNLSLPLSLAPQASSSALVLAVADFNNDNQPDVAFGTDHGVSVMRGLAADADTDVWSNVDEGYCGLDDADPDTDGDGMPDGYEERFNFCGLDAATDDALADSDGDGLANIFEYLTGSSPCLADTDGDGLTDGEEDYVTHTDPANADSDFDGVNDGQELQAGADPRNTQIAPRTITPGGEVRIGGATVSQYMPSLVWTGSEYGLAYAGSLTGIYDDTEIFFRRLSGAGALIGPEVRVTTAAQWSATPSLVWTGSQYGIAWYDFRDQAPGCTRDCTVSVYFARLAGDGSKLGGDVKVFSRPWGLSYGYNYTYLPELGLAWTGSEFGLSWAYAGYGTNPAGAIYFARLGADGTKLAPEKIIAGSRGSDDTSLAWSGSEFGMSWRYLISADPGFIAFARLSDQGQKLASEYVDDEPFLAYDIILSPDLAWSGSEYGIVWSRCYALTANALEFARIAADGTRLGPDATFSSSSYVCNSPSIAWTGSVYGLAWLESQFGSNKDLFLAQVGPDGSPLGTPMRVTNFASYKPAFSFAAADNGYGLAWEDWRAGSKIYFTGVVPDSDGDGLTDPDEQTIYGTNPLNWDTDGDGLADADEVLIYHTSPTLADSDHDGLTDGDEINVWHTLPTGWDSDSDRLPDGFEVANRAHAGGALDALDPADGAADFDGDGNANMNEYWNGSDPWMKDPVPGTYANPGCYYWADGDGDGTPAPADIIMLKLEIAGAAREYRFILPHGIDTLDLDRDGYAAPADLILLKLMVAGSERPGGFDSQANALEVMSAPSGSVATGTTTHVTVSVHSVGGTVAYAPGFGVVFEVVSGNATLLGGEGTADGEAAGNRYDFSMEASSGAKANIVVLVAGPGPVTIGAKVPACGTFPYGRWNDEVVLAPQVVINGL